VVEAGRVGKWRPSLHSHGIQHPEDWERMMGFPTGWTAVGPWATPLFPDVRLSFSAASLL
jgi:hypothetical protein